MSKIMPTGTAPTVLSFSLALDEGGAQIIAKTGTREEAQTMGTYSTDIQHVFVPLEAGSLKRIVADDVVEHVLDEQRFLEECARLLEIGGRLRIRVPSEGLTGWLDGVNIYRYFTDSTGRGNDPVEPKPTGWHRHYRNRDIVRLVTDAGFDVTSVRRVNFGLSEIPHAVGFFAGDFILGRSDTEQKLFVWRQRIAEWENRISAGPLGTRFEIVAYRV